MNKIFYLICFILLYINNSFSADVDVIKFIEKAFKNIDTIDSKFVQKDIYKNKIKHSGQGDIFLDTTGATCNFKLEYEMPYNFSIFFENSYLVYRNMESNTSRRINVKDFPLIDILCGKGDFSSLFHSVTIHQLEGDSFELTLNRKEDSLIIQLIKLEESIKIESIAMKGYNSKKLTKITLVY